MQQLMDPTRNMSNYRNLLSLQLQQSPAVSVGVLLFLIIIKDVYTAQVH